MPTYKNRFTIAKKFVKNDFKFDKTLGLAHMIEI